jgi:hypothetical protein
MTDDANNDDGKAQTPASGCDDDREPPTDTGSGDPEGGESDGDDVPDDSTSADGEDGDTDG